MGIILHKSKKFKESYSEISDEQREKEYWEGIEEKAKQLNATENGNKEIG